jgi:hypothetical protein
MVVCCPLDEERIGSPLRPRNRLLIALGSLVEDLEPSSRVVFCRKFLGKLLKEGSRLLFFSVSVKGVLLVILCPREAPCYAPLHAVPVSITMGLLVGKRGVLILPWRTRGEEFDKHPAGSTQHFIPAERGL